MCIMEPALGGRVGREPREYSVWGGIVQEGAGRFVVVVKALPVDSRGPDDWLTETRTAQTREAAKTLRLELLREVCARLASQGHRIVDADLQRDAED